MATQSNAPISSARRLTSAPACVSVETMMTGVGRSRMIFSRNSSPSMFGISMSSVTTSGVEHFDRLARLVRVRRLADHFDLRIGLQGRGDQPAHRRRIIDDQHAHGHGTPLFAVGR